MTLDTTTNFGLPLPHPENSPRTVDVPRLRAALTAIDELLKELQLEDGSIREAIAALDDAKADKDQVAIDITNAVSAAVSALLAEAPEAYDTLKEIADKLGDNDNVVGGILSSIGTLQSGKLDKTARAAASGVAPLNEDSIVTRTYLPLIADPQIGDVIASVGGPPNAEGTWLAMDGAKYLKASYPELDVKIPFLGFGVTDTFYVTGSPPTLSSPKLREFGDYLVATAPGSIGAGRVNFYSKTAQYLGSRVFNSATSDYPWIFDVVDGRLYYSAIGGDETGFHSIPLGADWTAEPLVEPFSSAVKSDLSNGGSIYKRNGEYFVFTANKLYKGPSLGDLTSVTTQVTAAFMGMGELPSGRLVSIGGTFGLSTKLFYSDDNGDTWTEGASLPADWRFGRWAGASGGVNGEIASFGGLVFFPVIAPSGSSRALFYTADGENLVNAGIPTGQLSTHRLKVWRDFLFVNREVVLKVEDGVPYRTVLPAYPQSLGDWNNAGSPYGDSLEIWGAHNETTFWVFRPTYDFETEFRVPLLSGALGVSFYVRGE